MKQGLAVSLVLLSGFGLGGCNGDEILLLGLDEAANPMEVVLTKKDYAERVGKALASVQESTLPMLANRPAGTGFMLRTLALGIGVSGEVGLGPFKVGAVPRFRVAFTNSSDPSFP